MVDLRVLHLLRSGPSSSFLLHMDLDFGPRQVGDVDGSPLGHTGQDLDPVGDFRLTHRGD